MSTIKAYGAASATAPIAPMTIERRSLTPSDVKVEILYCGICHSDLHYARNEWADVMPTIYPCVPGHEIIGRVVEVGPAVSRFKVGEVVGVGCLVDSDRTCPNCREGLEQILSQFHADLRHPGQARHRAGHASAATPRASSSTSTSCCGFPANLDLAAAAPLLCAGITTYSPLKHWEVGPGKKVGIVGIGGLGHMGVKFAHALGAHTVVFTTSPGKAAAALKLGADEVVVSTAADQMAKHAGSFDFILDCVAAPHDINAYIALLKRDGNITMVGAPEKPLPVAVFGLLFGRRSLSGSAIGGIAETQEMLDFCGAHNIVADVEVVGVQQINDAYARMLKSDVKYRFTIDMATLKG